MTFPNLQAVKAALHEAGVEVYQTKDQEIRVAERVRFHLMDSGVRVRLIDELCVAYTARSQRSDFPHVAIDELFEKVRQTVGSSARERGFEETTATTVEVTDPTDPTKVLDVWHEITYEKRSATVANTVDDVKWALGVEKYVSATE